MNKLKNRMFPMLHSVDYYVSSNLRAQVSNEVWQPVSISKRLLNLVNIHIHRDIKKNE